MKAGDLVWVVVPRNHSSPCHRLYDIPEAVIPHDGIGKFMFPQVVDKLWTGEPGVVLCVSGSKAHVLTPRARAGWIEVRHVSCVDPTGR